MFMFIIIWHLTFWYVCCLTGLCSSHCFHSHSTRTVINWNRQKKCWQCMFLQTMDMLKHPNVSNLCCDRAVLMVWLGWFTKKHSVRVLKKITFWSKNTRFCHHWSPDFLSKLCMFCRRKRGWKSSWGILKISSCVTFKSVETVWQLVENIQWLHAFFLEMQSLAWQPCRTTQPPALLPPDIICKSGYKHVM